MFSMNRKIALLAIAVASFFNIYGQSFFDELRERYNANLRSENYDSARWIANQIRWRASRLKSDPERIYAKSFLCLGDVSYNSGDLDSAIHWYTEAKRVLEKNQDLDHPFYFDCLSGLGIFYLEWGDPLLAKSYFLSCFNQLAHKNTESCADCGYYADKLGLSYFFLKNYDSAVFYAKYQLRLIEKTEGRNSESYTRVSMNIADVYNRQNKLFEADSIYRYLIYSDTEHQNRESCSQLESILGYSNFLNENDRSYAALDVLKSIDTACFSRSDAYRCQYRLNTAVAYNGVGEYRKAVKHFENMLLDSTAANCIKVADIYSNLAVSYFSMGNSEMAERYYLLGFSVPSHFEDSATTYYNLSLLKANQRNWLDALKYADSALQKTQKRTLKARLYNAMSECFVELGDVEKGVVYIDKAINTYVADSMMNNNAYADALVQKADIFNIQSQYDSAIYFVRRALDVYVTHELTGLVRFNFIQLEYARLNLLLGKQAEAITACETLLYKMIQDTRNNFMWLSSRQQEQLWKIYSSVTKGILNIASNCRLDDRRVASILYNNVLFSKSLLLENARYVTDLIVESSYPVIRTAYEKLRSDRSAFLKSDQAITDPIISSKDRTRRIDSLEKILVDYVSERSNIFQRQQINWSDIKKAISSEECVIEFTPFVDFKDSATKYMALMLTRDDDAPRAFVMGTEAEIQSAVLSKDFPSLYKLIWSHLEGQLSRIKTVYYSPSGVLNTVSFSGMCYGSGSWVSSLTNKPKLSRGGGVVGSASDQIEVCENYLIDQFQLHQLTTTRYLADGSLKATKPMRRSILLSGGINYDELPDRSLPIDSLDFTGPGAAFSSGWASNRKLANQQTGGAAARSVGEDAPMEYLAGTEREVKSIRSLLTASNWQISERGDRRAEEGLIKKELDHSTFGVIHFSTHGFAFPDPVFVSSSDIRLSSERAYRVSEDPMFRCGLLLSGANISWTGAPQRILEKTGEDGILTAAEVSNIDLSGTKLVVLSACETGLGKVEGAEGTFGLMRGFKLAGVEQLIVSLWKVPDAETQELMTNFYQALSRSNDPVASFEKAQKTMRLKYPNEPDKWAGFVLVR
jgi:tetratricopeptide (TPR) repeat protein